MYTTFLLALMALHRVARNWSHHTGKPSMMIFDSIGAKLFLSLSIVTNREAMYYMNPLNIKSFLIGTNLNILSTFSV